ncbi:major facilitator superfamily domain-containing protein [Mycena alexandri]|uniref:Major facilitator superfamily domain-containing protein n=1 Tax=Mycena alexandri TaxID=1745969 RepID=A0AAD6SVF4_9AGAR|nr:major facilitator superfamily domain-containing protein [Mycena alexandri]
MEYSEDAVTLLAQETTMKREPKFALSQFAILCCLRMLDPITFHQIVPYINQLVMDLGIVDTPAQVGYYSGMIESIFAVTGLVAVLFWGILADDIGRRPVILIGCAGMAVGTMLFGFATAYPSILICRAIIGFFAGNGSVLPTAVGDITDASNKDTYFPIFACFWPLGMIIGPIIGGQLSKPASRFLVLKDSLFLQQYPYALPSIVVAGLIIVVWGFAFVFLSETANYNHLRSEKRTVSVALVVRRLLDKPGAIVTLLSGQNPMLQALCYSGIITGFLSVAFDVVFTLFCYTPLESGGLSFPPEKIAFCFAVAGGVSTLQAFIMPRLLRRYGAERIYWMCTCSWPFAFIAIPFLNIIAWGAVIGPSPVWMEIFLWVCIAVILTVVRIGGAAFLYNTRILSDYLPSENLATGIGLLQVCVQFSRIFGPMVASGLFVASKEYSLVGGHLWALVLAIVGVGAAFTGRQVDLHTSRRDRSYGRSRDFLMTRRDS